MTTVSDTGDVLQVRNISKHYGGVKALNDVSFSVRKNEVIGLVGDNGAGKSSLIRILSGASRPTSGELVLDGTTHTFQNPSEATEAGITTVYQDLALVVNRDVPANFFLGRELVAQGLKGKIGWLDRKRMAQKTEEELARLHVRLPNLASHVADLSGGQRQALAIARAAAWCGGLLLLDEPTSALGVEQQAQVMELIRQVKDAGNSVLLVSHQMPHVMEVCDRVVVLRLGRVVAVLERHQLTAENLVGYITGALNAA